MADLLAFTVSKLGRRNVWTNRATGERWVNLGKSRSRQYQRIDAAGQPVGTPIPYRAGNDMFRAKPDLPAIPISEKPRNLPSPDWRSILWIIPDDEQDTLPMEPQYDPAQTFIESLPPLTWMAIYARGTLNEKYPNRDRAGQSQQWACVRDPGYAYESPQGWNMSMFDSIDRIAVEWKVQP